MTSGGPERSAFPGFDAMADDARALIERLSERRRRLGLSQTEVAARMGTSQSALARLESGRADVRISTLARYAAAMEADIGFALLDRESDVDRTVGDGTVGEGRLRVSSAREHGEGGRR